MNLENDTDKRILEHIFTVSPTMIGVCLGLIALLKVTNTALATYADEILSIDALIYMLSCFSSFLALKTKKIIWIKYLSDTLFFFGMLLLVISGAMIVFLECHITGINKLICPITR